MNDATETENAIFSFGTLQQEAVQKALFGRSVPTSPDSLSGGGWVRSGSSIRR